MINLKFLATNFFKYIWIKKIECWNGNKNYFYSNHLIEQSSILIIVLEENENTSTGSPLSFKFHSFYVSYFNHELNA